MTTDWLIFRRAAAELDRVLRGGRVTDCGLLEDGRFAIRFGGLRAGPGGDRSATLAVDVFGSPPLLALESAEPALAGDPGWTRAVSSALRGMRVLGVRARRGDRSRTGGRWRPCRRVGTGALSAGKHVPAGRFPTPGGV